MSAWKPRSAIFLLGQVRTSSQTREAQQRYRDKQRNRLRDAEAKAQEATAALEDMRREKVYLHPLRAHTLNPLLLPARLRRAHHPRLRCGPACQGLFTTSLRPAEQQFLDTCWRLLRTLCRS